MFFDTNYFERLIVLKLDRCVLKRFIFRYEFFLIMLARLKGVLIFDACFLIQTTLNVTLF